ncbi:MAG: hypothetical protein OXH77_12505 [Anaerolineaceae bacterium]|nr:hypothetical protein [Anaerolineaceae bacterium]
MSETDQINREIGELRGKLDGLATKEFVREVVEEQTRELNNRFDAKFDAIDRKFDHIDAKFDMIDARLREISERQQRYKGIGQALVFGLPFLISTLALAAVFLK